MQTLGFSTKFYDESLKCDVSECCEICCLLCLDAICHVTNCHRCLFLSGSWDPGPDLSTNAGAGGTDSKGRSTSITICKALARPAANSQVFPSRARSAASAFSFWKHLHVFLKGIRNYAIGLFFPSALYPFLVPWLCCLRFYTFLPEFLRTVLL